MANSTMTPQAENDNAQGQYKDVVNGSNFPIPTSILDTVPKYRQPSEDEINRRQSKCT